MMMVVVWKVLVRYGVEVLWDDWWEDMDGLLVVMGRCYCCC